jgi:hypothetical protein
MKSIVEQGVLHLYDSPGRPSILDKHQNMLKNIMTIVDNDSNADQGSHRQRREVNSY